MFLWLKTGFEHITDLQGYDHILFIMALCGVYALNEWKKILILVTAFTIGHSISLFLSVYNIVRVDAAWIEFLIPLSILCTTIYNLATGESENKSMKLPYTFALFFGLIHGLGFSNYLRALLGSEESIFIPLLNFNIGLEIGQLVVVLFVFLLHYIFDKFFKVSPKNWRFFLSSAVFGIALVMTLERIPF